MSAASFVAGDWGTSHLRLYLCGGDGEVLDSVDGPGAAAAGGRFADILDSLAARWQPLHGTLPTILCGMVGSSMGWAEACYIPCPAIPARIAGGCLALRAGSVRIVPGLSCRNRYGAPDFMRGEETQILGALRLAPELNRGRQLLCLPGTHTKWVLLVDGVVSEFLTAATGELFALLCQHSVLVRDHGGADAAADSAEFARALSSVQAYPDAELLHRLFECRARRLDGELTPQASVDYLSGLLIGSDISGALPLFAADSRTVRLIGAPRLTSAYQRALGARGCSSVSIEGASAAIAGLTLLQRQLPQQVALC